MEHKINIPAFSCKACSKNEKQVICTCPPEPEESWERRLRDFFKSDGLHGETFVESMTTIFKNELFRIEAQARADERDRIVKLVRGMIDGTRCFAPGKDCCCDSALSTLIAAAKETKE